MHSHTYFSKSAYGARGLDRTGQETDSQVYVVTCLRASGRAVRGEPGVRWKRQSQGLSHHPASYQTRKISSRILYLLDHTLEQDPRALSRCQLPSQEIGMVWMTTTNCSMQSFYYALYIHYLTTCTQQHLAVRSSLYLADEDTDDQSLSNLPKDRKQVSDRVEI